MSRLTYVLSFGLAAAGLITASGCATRKVAATQTTITAFDAAKSDPKALAIVDQMLTTLGGEANWAKAKEIIWTQSHLVDGKLVDWVTHSYDKWEGRHNFSRLDNKGQVGVVMYDLFDKTMYSYVEGEKGRAVQMKEDTAKLATEAEKRLYNDGYRVFGLFKLKDPGVHLTFSEERPAEDAKGDNPPMAIDVIKVTFDPGVMSAPGDVYYIDIDKATHMPLLVEYVPTGRPDTERNATRLEDWVEAGGLKFATKLTNVGYTKLDGPKVPVDVPAEWKGKEGKGGAVVKLTEVPKQSEIFSISNLKVNEAPDEDLYVPDVNKQ